MVSCSALSLKAVVRLLGLFCVVPSSSLYTALAAGRYDCIFGFSTGHVGTGTIGNPDSYDILDSKGIKFLFEGGKNTNERSVVVSRKKYMNKFTVEDEIEFVRNRLIPQFQGIKQGGFVNTIVDIGHTNLFYYQGIAAAFTSSANLPYQSRGNITTGSVCAKLLFIRIRRSRYEVATSLTHEAGGWVQLSDVFQLHRRFYPFDNVDRVVLKPPSKAVWNSFSVFQQALWVIDETEARWLQFSSQYYNHHSISFLEYFWSKDMPGSLKALVDEFAMLLGLHARAKLPNVNIHAGSVSKARQHDKKLIEEDTRYRHAMEPSVSKAGFCFNSSFTHLLQPKK